MTVSITNIPEEIEYIMRVKLPSSAGYHSSPSGDTEYEFDFQKAITERLPAGFDVVWSTQHLWPIDKDGLTWVKLRPNKIEDSIAHLSNEVLLLRQELARIKSLASEIIRN